MARGAGRWPAGTGGAGGWSADGMRIACVVPADGPGSANGSWAEAGRWPADGAWGLVVPTDGVRQLFLAR